MRDSHEFIIYFFEINLLHLLLKLWNNLSIQDLGPLPIGMNGIGYQVCVPLSLNLSGSNTFGFE